MGEHGIHTILHGKSRTEAGKAIYPSFKRNVKYTFKSVHRELTNSHWILYGTRQTSLSFQETGLGDRTADHNHYECSARRKINRLIDVTLDPLVIGNEKPIKCSRSTTDSRSSKCSSTLWPDKTKTKLSVDCCDITPKKDVATDQTGIML